MIPLLVGSLVALSIPSPSNGVWHLGPLPIRGYALCIIVGIVAAVWIGERRWVARGGRPGDVQDLAVWAVPFGLVGGRLYHVATDHARYFGDGNNPVTALYVWRGGLGIWGAIVLGAVGVYLGARTKGIRILPMLDALAPGVLIAQALGRFGNWFNQELYGKPTDLPWGLEIDPSNFPTQCDYPAGSGVCDIPPGTLFHPTFLYEAIWNVGAFGVLIWAERRFKLGFGRVVALYAMLYTLGRGWIEYLRIDDVELENVFGLRFNVWTSIVVFLLALAYFVVATRRHPGREETVYFPGFPKDVDDDDTTTTAATTEDAEDAKDADGHAPSAEADDPDDPDDDTPRGSEPPDDAGAASPAAEPRPGAS